MPATEVPSFAGADVGAGAPVSAPASEGWAGDRTGVPRVIGFTGNSGSGKTTLVERLIERFSRSGLRVAAIKHAHQGFDIDRPGKDSYRFREAGAAQVLVASERRWVLLSNEAPGAPPGDLQRQLARLDPCDLVLVEGYRGATGIPFIEVRRKATRAAEPGVARSAVPHLIAIATDEGPAAVGEAGAATLDLNDVEAIAQFVAHSIGVTLC